jgi:hypothetical protein
MNARLIIDICEAADISGEEVVDYMLGLGTEGGFYDKTVQAVLDRDFELTEVPIDEIRKSDPRFEKWFVKQELPRFKRYLPRHLKQLDAGHHEGNELELESKPDAPVIIIDGKLRDGWHRVAGAVSRGKSTVKAYVAKKA